MDKGSPSNRAIAEFLLRNPVRCAAWGIEELAAQAQVSTATLSRFARQLGFNNFAALRHAMAEAVQQLLQPVFKPVQKLRDVLDRGPQASQAVALEGLQAVLSNVQSTAAGLDAGVLAQVAQQVAQARVVYTMGFGISAHLAAMLELDLQAFCKQLVNVVEFGGTEVAAGRLMNIGPGDVLLVISLPRYASDAVTLAQYGRDRGAHVVAITDSLASPLTGPAHRTLLASAVHPVLSSSSTAALLVIEALVTSLMVARRANVQQAEKLTDAIASYLYRDKGRG